MSTPNMDWLVHAKDIALIAGVLVAGAGYLFTRRRATKGDASAEVRTLRDEMSTTVAGLRDEVLAAVNGLRDEVRRDAEAMRADVRDLRGDVNELRRDVGGIDKRLAVVETRLDERTAPLPRSEGGGLFDYGYPPGGGAK